tara:strand:+ start:501 stop:887 length:387 start_codon:yes stop_codon:yes gene_type:complete
MKKFTKNWYLLRHAGISEKDIEAKYKVWFERGAPDEFMEIMFVDAMLNEKDGGLKNRTAMFWVPASKTFEKLSSIGDRDFIKKEASAWTLGLLDSPTIVDLDAAFIGFLKKKNSRDDCANKKLFNSIF